MTSIAVVSPPTIESRVAALEAGHTTLLARTRRIELALYVSIALGLFGRYAEHVLPFLSF